MAHAFVGKDAIRRKTLSNLPKSVPHSNRRLNRFPRSKFKKDERLRRKLINSLQYLIDRKINEINFLGGPGKGVLLIKLDKGDKLLAAITATSDRDTLTVKTSMGGEQRLNTGRYKVTGRGGKGHEFVSRGQIVEVVYTPVAAPPPLE